MGSSVPVNQLPHSHAPPHPLVFCGASLVIMTYTNTEFSLQINAYMNSNSQNRLRQRTYSVMNHVKYGYRFMAIVRHPSQSR
jgi:hypothetical protein